MPGTLWFLAEVSNSTSYRRETTNYNKNLLACNCFWWVNYIIGEKSLGLLFVLVAEGV